MISILRGKYIYFSMFVVSILTWLTGAGVGWSSPITYKLTHHTYDYPFRQQATQEEISWIASVTILGCIFGSLLYGKLPDLIGRKNTLLLLSAPNILAYGILTWGNEIYLYIIARSILGLLIGGFFSVTSLYVSELTHHNQRGLFNSLMVTILYLGHVFSFSVAPYMTIATFNYILFMVSIILLPVLYFEAPETPYYLASVGREDEALAMLEKLRGYALDSSIKQEFDDIKLNTRKNEEGSIKDFFESIIARKAFFTMIIFAFFQAGTGVTPILMYAELFFQQAGTNISSEISPIIIGGVQMVTTFIVSLTCDKFGRRKLLLVSSIGTGIPLILLGVYFHLKQNGQDVGNISWIPLVSLIFCLIFHGIGLGPLPSVLLGELFPMNLKCLGTALVVSFMALENFLLIKYFPSASDTFGMATVIWFFSFMSIGCFVFIYFYLIETKGKTMNEIQLAWENQRISSLCE